MSRPVPGRPRSLGASLLDQVLAETVDPSYAAAAARRAARDAEQHPDEPAQDRDRRLARVRQRGQLLVALTLLVAGMLAAVTYREAAAGSQGRERVRQALAEDIQQESATTDDLADQLAELDQQVTRERDDALAASADGQRALRQLSAVESATALQAVHGPGLTVVLADAPPAADSDPVGGGTVTSSAGTVRDSDLQQVVNALWAAGAEAISINDQRLGPTTTIRQAGSAILVDFRPLGSPYRVRAIGDQQRLNNGFLTAPETDTLVNAANNYGLEFTYGRDEDLSLPAGTAPELRSAQPLTPTTGGPAAPADPDPATPGG